MPASKSFYYTIKFEFIHRFTISEVTGKMCKIIFEEHKDDVQKTFCECV